MGRFSSFYSLLFLVICDIPCRKGPSLGLYPRGLKKEEKGPLLQF